MTPRARRALRASAILAALLLATVAALEIGTRIYFAVRGRPLDTESRRAWIASVCEEMASHGEVEDDLSLIHI